MSTSPAPTVARGEITLQPSYFTSSLFVSPLKQDIEHLLHLFAQCYDGTRPFELFKTLWSDQGWPLFHLKVFDARSREAFLNVTLRLFADYISNHSNPLARLAALFAMYTFFFSQPSTSAPSLHSIKHIPLPIDVYQSLLNLPSSLTEPHLLPLQPYATHVLTTLLSAQVFHILPLSSLRPHNPCNLPREYFVEDGVDVATALGFSAGEASSSTAPPLKLEKKKGRPARRDKVKKAKDAVNALDKWLEKNTYTHPSAGPSTEAKTTHTLISHPPAASLAIYKIQKAELLDALNAGPEHDALVRANEAMLVRLRKIDEMAAEKGLEVGGEGGEMTGLTRVGKAVDELKEGKSRGGILDLVQGAGVTME